MMESLLLIAGVTSLVIIVIHEIEIELQNKRMLP